MVRNQVLRCHFHRQMAISPANARSVSPQGWYSSHRHEKIRAGREFFRRYKGQGRPCADRGQAEHLKQRAAAGGAPGGRTEAAQSAIVGLLPRVDAPGTALMASRTQPEVPQWNRLGYGDTRPGQVVSSSPTASARATCGRLEALSRVGIFLFWVRAQRATSRSLVPAISSRHFCEIYPRARSAPLNLEQSFLVQFLRGVPG